MSVETQLQRAGCSGIATGYTVCQGLLPNLSGPLGATTAARVQIKYRVKESMLPFLSRTIITKPNTDLVQVGTANLFAFCRLNALL